MKAFLLVFCLCLVGCATIPPGADPSQYATQGTAAVASDQQLVNTWWWQRDDRAWWGNKQPDDWLIAEMRTRGLLTQTALDREFGTWSLKLGLLPSEYSYRGNGRTVYVNGRAVSVSSNSASVRSRR